MLNNIKVYSFTGNALSPYLPIIARLRVDIFLEYPFLHQSNLEQELEHLRKYAESEEAIGVIVFDGATIVGASTGIPMEEEAELPLPGLDPADYFYFDQSLLLKAYRGRGIGHHFFDLREEHVNKLKRFHHIGFSSIARENPQYPLTHLPLEDFWRKRGYTQHPELSYSVSWTDIGQKKATDKTMAFWTKSLPH